MRESRIESYDAWFRSPLYSWMQLAGITAPLILIAEMGWLPSLFSIFERLGRVRSAGIDREQRATGSAANRLVP